MRNKTFILAAAIAAAMALYGCASLPPSVQGYMPNSADTYVPGQTQNVQAVRLGTVLAVRSVTIQPSTAQRTADSGVGALVGGLLGHQVGSGNGKTLATVAGAAGGLVGGNLVGNHMQRQPGLQVTVNLDSGTVINVTQSADVPLRVGERVQVIGSSYGGQPARIEPLQ